MTKLVCTKCGSEVKAYDRSKMDSIYLPHQMASMCEGGPRRYEARCSSSVFIEHGSGSGATPEEALAAYAKDQEWGMRQLERLAELEEAMRSISAISEGDAQ